MMKSKLPAKWLKDTERKTYFRNQRWSPWPRTKKGNFFPIHYITEFEKNSWGMANKAHSYPWTGQESLKTKEKDKRTEKKVV